MYVCGMGKYSDDGDNLLWTKGMYKQLVSLYCIFCEYPEL